MEEKKRTPTPGGKKEKGCLAVPRGGGGATTHRDTEREIEEENEKWYVCD